MNTAAYVPVESLFIGSLPEFPDEQKIYDLTQNGQIPASAKEVLLYTFVTTHNEGEFQRGHYAIFTSKEGVVEFKQYMSVATGQGGIVANSANMWFPMEDGKLKVKLIHPGDKYRSIAGKPAEQQDWSGLFIIGYR